MEEELALLSKVTRTPNVADFEWQYKDTYGGGGSEKVVLKDI